jgi:hypothetical protein
MAAMSRPRGVRRGRRGTHDHLGLRAPDEVPNPPETAPMRRRCSSAPIGSSLGFCRPFVTKHRLRRLPENRGVPGSSPGLATTKTPMASGFSCFRSGAPMASIGYPIGYPRPDVRRVRDRAPSVHRPSGLVRAKATTIPVVVRGGTLRRSRGWQSPRCLTRLNRLCARAGDSARLGVGLAAHLWRGADTPPRPTAARTLGHAHRSDAQPRSTGSGRDRATPAAR